MAAELDWEPIRAMGRRVIERGEPLELSDKVRALLQRSAEEVSVSPEDAASALSAYLGRKWNQVMMPRARWSIAR
ncbi:DUF3253 domain-containing protein [Hyalangium minutum]|uniref:DUF3253 domain-containing protein n=1 Tax=Hyalangium minutum TaxID=394096 RepID=UPI0023E36B24|nr:DUF3253 domain-containing protein [Hyalangium minutum]